MWKNKLNGFIVTDVDFGEDGYTRFRHKGLDDIMLTVDFLFNYEEVK